jgi:mRNA-degrading endonuclease HigB of HigAB toxin-antitoxin module
MLINNKKYMKMLLNTTEHNKQLEAKIDLEIGDYVRKVVSKSAFEKETTTFSKDIYVIFDKEGHKYRLINEDGEEVAGLYKYFELLKVDTSKLSITVRPLTDVLNDYYGLGSRLLGVGDDPPHDTTIKRRLKKEGIDSKNVIVRRKTRSNKGRTVKLP